MDIREAMQDLVGPPITPTMEQVDADLERGHRALRRRRVIRFGGGSLLAAAAAVATFVVGVPAITTTGPDGNTAAAPPATTVPSVQLVSYKGTQPEGFTVATVPDGWFVQNVNEYELMIAPEKVRTPGPAINPSTAPVYDPETAIDKIAVFLSSKDEGEPRGKKIKVGDRDGVLRRATPGDVNAPDNRPTPEPLRADGSYGASVYVRQPSGGYLVTQFWGGLGFTEQQMIEVAAGVHAVKGVARR